MEVWSICGGGFGMAVGAVGFSLKHGRFHLICGKVSIGIGRGKLGFFGCYEFGVGA